MPRVFYSNEACIATIEDLRTALANCTIDLFQDSLTPSITTTQAELAAAVANFSGYAQATVVALLAAYLDPAGGASANIATQQFQHNGGVVANIVRGAWVEDAGGTVRLIIQFDQDVPMNVATDAIPLDVIFNIKN